MKKNSISNKEQWEKREAYKLKQGLKDINKIEKELAKVYKEAMNEMVKEINNLFYKYATDNNLSYKEANKLYEDNYSELGVANEEQFNQ